MLNPIKSFVGAAALLAAITTGADAQGRGGGMAACRLDVATFCQGESGGRQTFACLVQNQDQISETCHSALEQRMAARAERREQRYAQQRSQPPGGQNQSDAQSEDRLESQQRLGAAPPTDNAPQRGRGRGGRGGMAACRVDLATFCQGTEAGRGKKSACLMQNQDKLSDDCHAALEQRQAAHEAGRADHGGGRQHRYAQIQPGGIQPGAQLPPRDLPSAQPGAAAAAPETGVPPGRRAPGRMAACRADMQTFCATIVGGGGRKMACLAENKDKVTPACAAALSERPMGVRARATSGLQDAQPAPEPPAPGVIPPKQ